MTSSVRPATNSLILTNVLDEILHDPHELIMDLAQRHEYCIELTSLTKFGRIILVFESSTAATEVMGLLHRSSKWQDINVTYSIRDNEFGKSTMKSIFINFEELSVLLNSDENNRMIDYLQLPLDAESKRFLISPPLSPPPGWDHWDKVEEGPHNGPMMEDISRLLWEKLGGNDSSMVRKFQNENIEPDDEGHVDLSVKPEVLFEGLDEGVPAIIIDPSSTVPLKNKQHKPLPKTAFPSTDGY